MYVMTYKREFDEEIGPVQPMQPISGTDTFQRDININISGLVLNALAEKAQLS